MAYLVILGGNEMACPAIQRFMDLGHAVLVVDGNPDAPARALADVFVCSNFSDIKATEAALAEFEISGIMPINDFGVRTAAYVASQRGLPGNTVQAALAATNKRVMRESWALAGLPQPRFTACSVGSILSGNMPDWSDFPCIVKPTYSGGGSRAVVLANNREEIVSHVRETQSEYLDQEVIIEEFIQGTEHTIEVLFWPAGMKLLSISDKENYPGNVAVVQNLYFPGPIGHRFRDQIEQLVYSACRALNFRIGAAHFEVLIRDGRVYLLEVGGRPGGGLNLHPICELSTGYDYAGLYAAVLNGQPPDFSRKKSVHLAWHYFPAGDGRVLLAIEGLDVVAGTPNVVDFKVYEAIGKPRFKLRNDLARPGYILVQSDSHEAARDRASDLVSQVEFKTA